MRVPFLVTHKSAILGRFKKQMFSFLNLLDASTLHTNINKQANRELAARMVKREGTGQGCLYKMKGC
jgi:hypothetical protein